MVTACPARGAAGNQQPNVWPGTVLDGELIVVGDRGGITDTAAAEVPGSPGQLDDALT
jgi:hypothetical protein